MIPDKFEGTIYFYWNLRYDWLTVSDDDISHSEDYVLLGSQEFSVDFRVKEAVQEGVEKLGGLICQERVESEKKIHRLEERISNLLMIEHEDLSEENSAGTV